VKEIFPLIAAIGAGGMFQPPLIALQAAMPLKDMATSTAAFGFIRTLAGTVGISIGQAIFTSVRENLQYIFFELFGSLFFIQRLSKRLQDLGPETIAAVGSSGSLTESVRHLGDLPVCL
jgi:hypothetical protein